MARKNKHSIIFAPEKRKNKDTGRTIADNVPINMVVTWNRRRLLFYVGYRIDLSKWDVPTQRVVKNTFNRDKDNASTINARLVKLESTVNELFLNTNRIPTPDELRAKLRAAIDEKTNSSKGLTLFGYFEKYIQNTKVSDPRKEQIQVVYNHLNRFLKNDNLKISDITKEHIEKFTRYLKTDDPPKSENTINGILKKLKAFFRYAINEGWTDSNPFNKVKIEAERYGEPIYLTKKERDELYFAEIENERLARTRDMFVLQCLIGCRVGDYVKLKHSNIIDGFIQYIPGKTKDETGKECKVPLSEKARAIISKYDLPDGSLLPYITDQRYNDYIKELFLLVGLTRPVVRLNPLTRENEIVPLNKIASSHMARRTFVGLLHKTVKNEVIASMSGHVENSKAFARYYKIDAESQIDAIKTIE